MTYRTVMAQASKYKISRLPTEDRRHESPENSVWWEKLTLAQKFSASSMGKFGYEIAFVRHEKGHSLAVLKCPGGLAVIFEDGDIDTSPVIKIRD